jgi:hypothetical protein
MASWNTIYFGTFDAFDAPAQYSIEIAKKDYVGDAFELTLSAIPVTQEWQEEGPKVAIKGCNLTIRMISKRLNGIEFSFSLADFYSEEDDTFLVYLYDNTNGVKLFKGFIVQDDCKEIQVDYAHEIVISATDNLGLLKDRRFDEAAYITGTDTSISENITFIAPRTLFIGNPSAAVTFAVGTQIEVSTIGVFTVSNILFTPFVGWFITVVEDVIDIADAPYVITWRIPTTITGFLPLREIFRICLDSLGIGIGARVYSQLYPIGGSTGRWFDDTYIVGDSFYNNQEWLTCYEILERILSRFRASLFQSNGSWTIVRWGELWRYTTVEGATIPSNVYNLSWDYVGTGQSTQNFHFGDGTDCETGVLKSINRPWNFVQETFNYNTYELIENINLQQLGPLRISYTSGTETFYEYDLPYWVNFDFTPPPITNPNRFIRVVKDVNNNEIERYIVLENPVEPYFYAALQSNDIFLSAGDTIEYSLDFKPKNWSFFYTDPFYIMIQLFDGTTRYFLNNNGEWQTTLNYLDFPKFTYDDPLINLTFWNNWVIKSRALPIDGKLNVFLFTPNFTFNSWNEMHFKNLAFKVTFLIDGTIVGHTNTDRQVPNRVIKNNESVEIFVDDTPRSSISGTLFIDTFTNFNRNRTTKWNYIDASLEYSLGQLVTIEQLFQRWYPKDIYNGTTTYIKNNDGWIMNPMSVFLDGQVPELKRYVTGSLSVDYKNSACDFTIYELDNSDRTMAEFNTSNLYEFNYLYQKS